MNLSLKLITLSAAALLMAWPTQADARCKSSRKTSHHRCSTVYTGCSSYYDYGYPYYGSYYYTRPVVYTGAYYGFPYYYGTAYSSCR